MNTKLEEKLSVEDLNFLIHNLEFMRSIIGNNKRFRKLALKAGRVPNASLFKEINGLLNTAEDLYKASNIANFKEVQQ